MVSKFLMLLVGIGVGVGSCLLAQSLIRSSNSRHLSARIENGQQFAVVSPPYVILTGQSEGSLQIVLLENNKECAGLSAQAGVIKYTSWVYVNGQKATQMDLDGDGVPDIKLIYGEDGSTQNTQLFFNGAFVDARRDATGWLVGSTAVEFKDHQWRPKAVDGRKE
jgi:hypothetical protein